MALARSGRIVIIVVVVVVLVVLVGGGAAWWFLLRPTPEQAIEEFMAAAAAKDTEKARSLLSQTTLQLADELAKQIETQFAGFPGAADMPQGDDAAVEIVQEMLAQVESFGEATVQGDTATISVEAKAGMGARLTEVKLVKEGGRWKIDATETLKMIQQFMGPIAELAKQFASAFEGMGEGMAEGMAESMGEAMGEAASPAPAKDAATLVAEAGAAKGAGKLDEAASKYEQALAQDANNVGAHWGLAWVLSSQKKNKEATTHFEQVAKLSGDQKQVTEAKAAIERLK
ncbi:MAG: tetratricopeptide repeat protein [Armatimonadota bacterium]